MKKVIYTKVKSGCTDAQLDLVTILRFSRMIVKPLSLFLICSHCRVNKECSFWITRTAIPKPRKFTRWQDSTVPTLYHLNGLLDLSAGT